MRRTLLYFSIALLALAAIPLHLGCGSDSTTAPETPEAKPYLPYIKNAQTGYIYRWAGVVRADGVGVAGKGEQGQAPGETALYWPQDVAFDPTGRIYVLDWNNHRVLGLNDNITFKEIIGGRFGDGHDGQATEIGLNHPTGVSFDPQGRLILSAWHNSIVKRLNAETGWIETICGRDDLTNNRRYNGDGIPANEATLDLPVNVIFDSAGNMYIGDQASMIVRMVDTNGIIHTVAGTPPEVKTFTECESGCGACQSKNFADQTVYVRYCGYSGNGGPATEAKLNTEFGQAANPAGRICFDSMENLYIADTRNNCIRKVDKVTGTISTVAGVGPNEWGYNEADEGIPATQAPLFLPRDIVFDDMDNLYIADTGHHCIRRVDSDGVITTVAGTPGVSGTPGTDKIAARQARLNQPYGVEFGPDGNLWIADRSNNVIRVLIMD
jgi:streptogramin lyase